MFGDTYGIPQDQFGVPSGGGLGGLGQNPLLQIGLGILANNQGNYGSAGAAIGKGAMQGIQNVQQAKQEFVRQQLMTQELKRIKDQEDRQKQAEDYMKSYGVNNDSNVTTTPATNIPAPSNGASPNYGLIPQAAQTTETPTFNQDKWLSGALASGALGLKDYLSLTSKDNNHTWTDGGDRLIQIDHDGNPTGLTIPKNASADARLNAGVSLQNNASNNAVSRANNSASVGATMRGQDMTQQSEANKLDPFGLNKKSGSYTITAPDGNVYTFKDQKSLNNFKLKAGL